MKLTNILNDSDDSRAVSPVIGVILMVAITVILAAVIGTFVLGLGDSVESAPQASFGFQESGSDVTITHRGGETIQGSDLEVRVDGSPTNNQFSGTQIGAGTSISISEASRNSDNTIDIVYTGNSDETIIASHQT